LHISITMKKTTLPTSVLSHSLARGVEINPDLIADRIYEDRKLGYFGTAIVPALCDMSQRIRILEAFKDQSADTIIVGFNAGSGPSPINDGEWKACLKALKPSARMVADGADMGVCPPVLVGPTHTHHGTEMPMWTQARFDRWMKALNKLGRDYGIDIAPEPLNPTEDKTNDPFNKVFFAAEAHKNIKLHWDTGHAFMQGLDATHMLDYTKHIEYFEFANVGRSPLNVSRGIDFGLYIESLPLLKQRCAIGNEPFCKDVIKAFGLGNLCDTLVDGPDALAEDARFLRARGVMV